MNHFKAEQLAALAARCENLISSTGFQIAHDQAGDPPHPDARAQIPEWLANAKELFRAVELRDSLQQLTLAEYHLSDASSLNAAVMESELRRILETLIVELRERKFLYVAPDRSDYFENEALFGDSVRLQYPLASADLKAAGNCFAAECHTAGVFHLMLAFEWALRKFCADLGLVRLRDWSKKDGKFKYTPASYAVWEKLLNQLPRKIEKRLSRLRPGRKKQALQDYYASALDDIKAVKDAWRNHVMHTHVTYNREAAQSVYRHVEGIMKRLATPVTVSTT